MEFFDKYSYKQKNYALAILSVLLIAVSYKRAFSVSIETSEYKQELEDKLIVAESAGQDIRMKQEQLAKLNLMLGEENNTIEKVQQGFLNFFALNTDELTVHEISEVLNYKHPDFSINTHRIVLKGDYLNTLDFIYKLERDFKLAKILNTTFEYKKYNSEEEKDLYTTLLIQNYLR
ncbi:MAG: hypothetical protein MK066_09025 [Crocinitomicaceae bacterium]|nr:hypothetical protein [Crocinitomicaceae bacterium]